MFWLRRIFLAGVFALGFLPTVVNAIPIADYEVFFRVDRQGQAGSFPAPINIGDVLSGQFTLSQSPIGGMDFFPDNLGGFVIGGIDFGNPDFLDSKAPTFLPNGDIDLWHIQFTVSDPAGDWVFQLRDNGDWFAKII